MKAFGQVLAVTGFLVLGNRAVLWLARHSFGDFGRRNYSVDRPWVRLLVRATPIALVALALGAALIALG